MRSPRSTRTDHLFPSTTLFRSSGTTAMFRGVMIMVGLRPGPMLFEQQPHFLGALFAGLLLSNIVFLVIGIFMARWFARISLVDDSYLWPAIGVFCVIGAYPLHASVVDLAVMIIFSVVGLIRSEERRVGTEWVSTC